MTFNPVKFANDGLDPVGSHLDRLFMFWQCYVEEERLLADWHDSTANYPGKPTSNPLFNSFLDSWGEGTWEDLKDENVPFEKRSYFQALGVVSRRLIEEIQAKVLKDFVVPDGKTWRLRRDLSEVDRTNGEKLAKDEITTLLAAFDTCRIPSLKNVDKKVEDERDTEKCREDSTVYLDALVRMMNIEIDCFITQAHFLKEGKVLP